MFEPSQVCQSDEIADLDYKLGGLMAMRACSHLNMTIMLL
jgi:hypothetical protein